MRITFDSGATAPNEKFNLGILHIDLPDEKVKEYVEALIILGYEPEVTLG